MPHFALGDTVQVAHSRVHPGIGRVIELLPVRVRVRFPTGGFGGGEYIDDFPPAKLEHVPEPIAVGQVWEREPTAQRYRIIEAGDGGFLQDIVLLNLDTDRISRISLNGLRTKFTRIGTP